MEWYEIVTVMCQLITITTQVYIYTTMKKTERILDEL